MSKPDLTALLKESHAFHYGQQYERRRLGELIRQRITVVRELRLTGLPHDIADGIIDELKALCVAIDEAR
jgi:hypothetical protein